MSSATGNPGLPSVRHPDIDAGSEQLRPLAQVLSRQMLYNEAAPSGRLDIAADLTRPLPLTIICGLLDIPWRPVSGIATHSPQRVIGNRSGPQQ